VASRWRPASKIKPMVAGITTIAASRLSLENTPTKRRIVPCDGCDKPSAASASCGKRRQIPPRTISTSMSRKPPPSTSMRRMAALGATRS